LGGSQVSGGGAAFYGAIALSLTLPSDVRHCAGTLGAAGGAPPAPSKFSSMCHQEAKLTPQNGTLVLSQVGARLLLCATFVYSSKTILTQT